ncbi:MAG: HAMP domain-containing histidine kinase [Candidatus Cloacimonetes bacterium]|nr:HAMP domain-containing histidine kinase [Candidatus Cloacimonadota bacterium]
MKSSRRNTIFIRYYFIIGSIIIILFFVLYTNTLLLKVRKELEVFPKIYARFAEVSTKENIESDLLEIILTEVVQKVNYPIIVTDENNMPKYWKNIDIPSGDMNSLPETEQEHIKHIVNKMAKGESHILLKEPNTGEIISKIFYSESQTIKRLKFLPYLEFLIVILFIAIGTFGIILMKRREREYLWIALAKETAHQFGTPITSILGWIEVLKSKIYESLKNENLPKILNQMKLDVQHLQDIASRFGKVGSSIQLKESDLDKTIIKTIEYFKPRIPKENLKINLNYIKKTEKNLFYFDPDLLKWALENLIKNSIDAMKGKSGNIFIITYQKGRKVYIQIKDQGVGIPKNIQRLVFDTGFTTKNRGWGLGLSLAKRIIEEFHKGKICILKSELNVGTTFEIMLSEHKE